MRISLTIALFLFGACAIKIKAIDINKTGASQNSTGGGCRDPGASGSITEASLSLLDVTVNDQDYKKDVGDANGCVDTVEDLVFDTRITTLDNGTACGPDGDALRGELTLSHLLLSADKGPSEYAIECPNASASLQDAAALKAAADACGNSQKDVLKEWLREAVNAKATAIRFQVVGGCAEDSCFTIKYAIHVRFVNPTLLIGGACPSKRAPLN